MFRRRGVLPYYPTLTKQGFNGGRFPSAAAGAAMDRRVASVPRAEDFRRGTRWELFEPYMLHLHHLYVSSIALACDESVMVSGAGVHPALVARCHSSHSSAA